MNLRTKFSIFPITLAIIVLCISLLFTLRIPNRIIKNQTRNYLIANAQSRANNIVSLINNYTDIVRVLSVGNTIINVFDSTLDRTNRMAAANVRIRRAIEANPNIFRIKILNSSGHVIVSSRDDCDLELCEKTDLANRKDGVYIGDIHKSKQSGNLVISTSAPIILNDTFCGALVVNFEVEEDLFEIMTNRIGLEETEEIYLVNKDGYIITPTKIIDDSILEQKINTEQVNLCIMEHVEEDVFSRMEETPTEYLNYAGRKVIGTHRYIPEMQWAVIAEFDLKKANEPIRDNIILVLTIFFVLLPLILIVGVFISRNTIMQIIKLQKGTEEIIKGNLDHRIGIKSKDEIGMLARSFDAMTCRLQKAQNKLVNYTEDLETTVKERTAELEKQFEKSKKQGIANLVIMKELEDKTKELKAEIVERKLAELDLSKSEYKFRLLANNTYDWEYWIDPQGKYIFISKSCERITGYSVDDFYNNPELLFNLIHPDYSDMVRMHYRGEEDGHLPYVKIEFQIINRSGEKRWIEHNCIPVFDEQGNFIGRRGNNRDITDRKIAEEKINNTHKLLEELYQHQDEIKENERKSISREIHDQLGQLLSALKIDLGWTKDNVEKEVDVKKKIKGMIATVSEIIKSVQRISSDLRPGLLDDLGLVSAMEWYIQEFEQRTGIQCHFKPESVQFPNERKNLAIYRILQEALTNVIRHANAKNVMINLRKEDDAVVLEIIDDGIGMKKDKIDSPKSLGFIGIMERVKQYNGSLDITSAVGKGTTLRVIIPFGKKSANATNTNM